MSRGINRVTLIGNLGQDPEVRVMPNGNYVTNISIATTEAWKDKQTGQPVEKVEWHRVIFFNRLAEIAGEYLTKGAQVYIEGKLQTRKWTDKDGVDRYTTEIISNEMQMLGGGGGSNNNTGTSSGNQASSPQQPKNDQQSPSNQPEQNSRPLMEDLSDDIPF